MINQIHCPLCKSELKTIFTTKDYLVSGEKFDIEECSNCRLRMTNPFPDKEKIGNYYESDAYISHAEESKGIFDSIYNMVRSYMLGRKRKIVENSSGIKQGSLLDIVIENIKTYGTVWSQIVSSVPQNIPDPAKNLLETSPAAHTTMGGIVVNEKCETTVSMLYAAGGVAGGIYGHARPAGYTSMIPLVYGKRAGKSAAQMSLITKQKDIDFEEILSSQDLLNITDIDTKKIKNEIKNIMYSHCWIIRDNHTLTKGLSKIQKVVNDLSNSKGKLHKIIPNKLLEIYEIRNMLDCAEMMISGSLLRKETRGAFRRSDYPELDNKNWLKNLRYKQINGHLKIYPTDVDLKYCKPDNVIIK